MTMRPFPRGTRHTVRHLGQAMYLCSRSRIRVRVRPKAFFTGQHTLLMNHAFSARRLARFRENIRHSAHSTMAVDRVDRIRYGT